MRKEIYFHLAIHRFLIFNPFSFRTRAPILELDLRNLAADIASSSSSSDESLILIVRRNTRLFLKAVIPTYTYSIAYPIALFSSRKPIAKLFSNKESV